MNEVVFLDGVKTQQTINNGDGTATRTSYGEGDPEVEIVDMDPPTPPSVLEILESMDLSTAVLITETPAQNMGHAIGMAVAITQPDKVEALATARDTLDADAGVTALADSVEEAVAE